ncbi:hypothetical protein [Agrobacterium sp. MA01]|uniref:hypothetical protein n=1 Tax=Rhizobium/Agrobacterium group TaxID=227290 RepID=UPI001FEE3FBC|nr:hypothetical protein [Agrobacterium sp. MA01]
MTRFLRRTLLVSTTALAALTLIPAIASLAPSTLASFVVSQAEARGGDDDGGSDDSGDSGGGGSDDSGSDDSGRDDSGRDSSDDDDDDSSGRDRDRDRDRNRSGDDDDDDGYDDSDDRYDDSAEDGSRRSGNRDRDEIRLIVNNTQLQGLLSGSMIPVDQNGKRLRFEVEQEHGNTEIKLRAPRGTLSSVTVVPAI